MGISPEAIRTKAVHGELETNRNGREHESMEHTVGMKGSETWNKKRNQNDDAQQCKLPNQLPVRRRAWCGEVLGTGSG